MTSSKVVGPDQGFRSRHRPLRRREESRLPSPRLRVLLAALILGLALLAFVRPWRYVLQARSVPTFLVPQLVDLAVGPARAPADHLRAAQLLAERGYHLAALRRLRKAELLGADRDRLLRMRAATLVAIGREEEGERLYQELVTRDPDDPELLLRLLITQVKTGRVKAARASLTRLLALSVSDPSQRVALVREALIAYFNLGDLNATLRLARQYRQLQPRDPGGHLALARAAFGLHRYREALAALDKAARLAPDDGTILMLRAQTRFVAGGYRYTAAVVADLQRAIRLNPLLGRAHYYLGGYYASRGRWKAAAGEYLKAFDLGTEPAQSLRKLSQACFKIGMQLEGHYRLGQYYELMGQVDRALQEFQALWKRQPCCAAGYVRHSDALRRANRLPEARRILLRGLKRVPGDVTLTRRLAETSMLLGQLDAARRLLLNLLEQDPHRRALTLRDLAAVAEGQSQYDLAEQYYRQSLALVPDDLPTRLRLGDLYFQRRTLGNRLKLAEKEYQWVVEHGPESFEALSRLASVYAEQGRLQDAADLVRHAIDLAPGKGPYYQQLGQICQRLGDREEAAWALGEYRKYLEFQNELMARSRAVHARPRSGQARLRFGLLLLRAGDYVAATRELQAAMALNSKSPVIRLALAAAYDGLGRSEEAASLRSQTATR